MVRIVGFLNKGIKWVGPACWTGEGFYQDWTLTTKKQHLTGSPFNLILYLFKNQITTECSKNPACQRYIVLGKLIPLCVCPRLSHPLMKMWSYDVTRSSRACLCCFCFRGLNVSVFLVSGGLLVCLLPGWTGCGCVSLSSHTGCLCVRGRAAASEKRLLLHRMCFILISICFKHSFVCFCSSLNSFTTTN